MTLDIADLEKAALALARIIATEGISESQARRAAFLSFDLQNLITDLRSHYGKP